VRKSNLSIFLLVLGISLLSLGTVVQKKDGIQLTQTDPIAYVEKAKEEAEGKKGPPVPSLKLFPRERFLAEGPVDETEEAVSTEEEALFEFWEEEELVLDEGELEEGEGEEEGEEMEEKEIPQVKAGEETDDSMEELDSEETSWWEEETPPS